MAGELPRQRCLAIQWAKVDLVKLFDNELTRPQNQSFILSLQFGRAYRKLIDANRHCDDCDQQPERKDRKLRVLHDVTAMARFVAFASSWPVGWYAAKTRPCRARVERNACGYARNASEMRIVFIMPDSTLEVARFGRVHRYFLAIHGARSNGQFATEITVKVCWRSLFCRSSSSPQAKVLSFPLIPPLPAHSQRFSDVPDSFA